jgi:hypothetical protein
VNKSTSVSLSKQLHVQWEQYLLRSIICCGSSTLLECKLLSWKAINNFLLYSTLQPPIITFDGIRTEKQKKGKKRFYKFCQSHAMLTTTEDEGNSELRALHLVKNKHGMTCKIGAAIAKCNLDFMHYLAEIKWKWKLLNVIMYNFIM